MLIPEDAIDAKYDLVGTNDTVGENA